MIFLGQGCIHVLHCIIILDAIPLWMNKFSCTFWAISFPAYEKKYMSQFNITEQPSIRAYLFNQYQILNCLILQDWGGGKI